LRQLAEELKAEARRQGADLAGLAKAEPLPEADAYRDWVASGMHGTMEYMARNADSRRDISCWYPEAKSILLCGFSYGQAPARAAAAGEGRVARYAALPDYHPELKGRMTAVLDWLKVREPSAEGRVFVDTSPLLERLYARYAGLGFIGKNTMLLSPRLGSYLFLAGLALNLELPADQPETDHCGSCRRCLDACPTDAFPRKRVLDATRCIAYFTIEHRGSIPEAFREGVGDWVMGCDVCQEVCPWNRFSRPGEVFPAQARLGLALDELASLTEAEFKARFGATPVARAKRRGLARNAALAMGNSRDPRFRPALERLGQDPDPAVREQAAWGLARLPPPSQE
jgi:epoxyqueuosine reductase